MKTDALHQREIALENEFFHRVDQQLLADLRAKIQHEAAVAALSDVSDIKDRQLLDELVHLHVTPAALAAVSLIPLVLVAWSDGKVDEKERTAILSLALQEGMPIDSPSYQLLEFWLDREPFAELADTWTHYVSAIGHSLTDDAKQLFISHIARMARLVAGTSGGVMGVGKVSSAERQVLDMLDRTFAEDL